MRQAADGVAASLATAAPAEDRQRAAILQARGRRRTPPGKIVADGRLQPEPRGIAAPMTRFTVQSNDAGVAPDRQEHDALGNKHPAANERAGLPEQMEGETDEGHQLPGPCAHGVPDWLTAAIATTCKMPIHVGEHLADGAFRQPTPAKRVEDEQSRAPCQSRCAPTRAPVHGGHAFHRAVLRPTTLAKKGAEAPGPTKVRVPRRTLFAGRQQ